MICVSERTVKWLAAIEPKYTVVAPLKPVPAIVTVVPPAAGPDAAWTPITPTTKLIMPGTSEFTTGVPKPVTSL